MFLVLELIEGRLKDNKEKLSIFSIDCLLSTVSVYSSNTCSQAPPKYLFVIRNSAINRIYNNITLMETRVKVKRHIVNEINM